MITEDEIRDLIPAFALGVLEPDEAAQVQGHLPTCSICRAELAEYQRVNEALALSPVQLEPPGSLKAKALKVSMPRVAAPMPKQAAVPTTAARSRFPFIPAAAVALALVSLLLLAWGFMEFSRQLAEQRDLVAVMAYADGPAVTVHGNAAAPLAVGKLYLDPDSNVAALITVNMPSLANGQVYQVSLTEPDGTLASGGNFHVDTNGNGWLLIRAPKRLDAYQSFSISPVNENSAGAPVGPPLFQTELNFH